jgi:hypothetical protein
MNALFGMGFEDFKMNASAISLSIEKGASIENLLDETIEILDKQEKENLNLIED